jgi:hypothetical protein
MGGNHMKGESVDGIYPVCEGVLRACRVHAVKASINPSWKSEIGEERRQESQLAPRSERMRIMSRNAVIVR